MMLLIPNGNLTGICYAITRKAGSSSRGLVGELVFLYITRSSTVDINHEMKYNFDIDVEIGKRRT